MSNNTNIVHTDGIPKALKKRILAIQAHFDARFEETIEAIETILDRLAVVHDMVQEEPDDRRSEYDQLKDMVLTEQHRQRYLLRGIWGVFEVLLVAGVCLTVWPYMTLEVVGQLFGAALIVWLICLGLTWTRMD
jgi:hypothetical protein